MVALLFIAGLQVPVIPFVEVVGKAASVAPAQTGATCVNAGVCACCILRLMIKLVSQILVPVTFMVS